MDDQVSAEEQLSNAFDAYKAGRTDLNAKSLGRTLSYRKDRIVDGLSLEKVKDVKNTIQWRVRCCEMSEL